MKSSAKILVIILIGIFLVQNISLIIAQGPPTPEAVNKFENGPPFPETELCLDSDYGNNPEVGGLVAYNQKDFKDFCSGNILTEYFCSNQNSKGPPTPESTNFGISNRTYNCTSYCQNKYGLTYSGSCSLSFEGFGFCNCTLAIPVKNEKDPNKYSKKNAFLISDKNWREILSLVPLTTWTSEKDSEWCQKGYGTPSKVCVYPTLIYHREGESFDADSIIYFFQQYKPDNLTIIGNTPPELDNLLIVKPELGAGLKEEQIKKISFNDYFSYWKSFNSIVVVDYDNYANGLMGSVWASLKNIPIIFVNSNNLENYKNVIDNRKIYIIGKIDSSVSDYINKNAKSSISYTLEELQKEYIKETNTDKIILVNPNDLDLKVIKRFLPEKSTKSFSELFSKISLAAPFLAAGKHEVIIDTTSTDYKKIDAFVENKIAAIGINPEYLTILASPVSIPISRPATQKDGCKYAKFIEVDGRFYGELDHDNLVDLSTGRIFGVSISDASSYIARSIFIKDIVSNNFDALIVLPGYGTSTTKGEMIKFSKYFWTPNIINQLDSHYFYAGWYDVLFRIFKIKNLYDDSNLIIYYNHGSKTAFSMLISSYDFSSNNIYLNNPIIMNVACLTCCWSGNPNSFCVQNIRRGALGFQGAVDISYWNKEFDDILNGFVLEGKSIGTAYKEARNQDYKDNIYNFCLGLRGDIFYAWIGDPTIKFDEIRK